MKLYGSLTSPYVRKVRILLKEKGLPGDFIVQAPNEPDSIVPELNPLGKVPVMMRDDGRVLYDSALIVDYLDALAQPRLIPEGGDSRWDVLLWHTLAMGMVDATVARSMETRRPADKQLPAAIAHQEKKVMRGLESADRTGKGKTFLVDDRLTLADIALAVALDYIDFRFPHDWRSRHPNLAEWQAAIGARPAFMETLPPDFTKPTH